MSSVQKGLFLFVGGAVVGFASMMNLACGKEECREAPCPAPQHIEVGQHAVGTQSEWFEQAGAVSPLPKMSNGELSVKSEENVVILTYTDQLGGPAQITFEKRADGGGAGEGGG